MGLQEANGRRLAQFSLVSRAYSIKVSHIHSLPPHLPMGASIQGSDAIETSALISGNKNLKKLSSQENIVHTIWRILLLSGRPGILLTQGCSSESQGTEPPLFETRTCPYRTGRNLFLWQPVRGN